MLNENLAKIRKERGLTQEALAIKLNVVRQTISKWEKGTAVPDADTLCKVADALDVSVSVLLGDPEQEDKPDMASIAKSLAQINEQLAIRNHRAANVWKVVCLLSLIVTGILIGKVYFGNNSSQDALKVLLPEKIGVSGVGFHGNDEELICSFVPSIGNSKIVYTVTFHSDDKIYPDATAVAKYENGICTAVFETSKLVEYTQYSVVLNIDYRGDVRNLTLAEGFQFMKDGYSWEPKWD